MKINRKISAFTLTEMLVVLGITSIVAGLAFGIVSMFSRNIQSIQKNYTGNTQLYLFEQQLKIDMNTFPSSRYRMDENLLTLVSPIDSVQYQFTGDYILRKNDTLHSTKSTVEFFFLGKPVTKGAVDAIKVKLDSVHEKILFIHKKNDAVQYFQAYGD